MILPAQPFTVTRHARDRVFFNIGDSIAEFWGYKVAAYSFKTKYVSLVSGVTNGVDIFTSAEGGSCAASTNTTDPTNFWWNISSSSAGPRLTTALGVITSLQGLAFSLHPTDLHICLGTNDAQAMANAAPSPASHQTDFQTALTAIISAMRTAMNSGSPTSVRVFIDIPGRDIFVNPGGMERARQGVLDVIAAGTNIFRGAELYDLELRDNVHPSDVGRVHQGERNATQFAIHRDSVTGLFSGPSITSVTTSGTTVTISLNAESGDAITFPAKFCCLRIEDSANPGVAIGQTSVTGSGTTISVVIPTALTGSPVLFYPYDNCSDFNPAQIPVGSVSGLPLKSWKR